MQTFIVTDVVQSIGAEGHSFFKNGLDAQNLCRTGNQLLVLRLSVPITMISGHRPMYHLMCDAVHDRLIARINHPRSALE